MVFQISQLVVAVVVLGAVASGHPTRIVGGNDAAMEEFPFQVSLFKDGSFTCGGSIISSRYVLTAAHCVVVGNGIETLPARYFVVRVGSIQRQAGGKLVPIKNVIVNKNFANLLDDVALLELENELTFTNSIKAIELYEEEVPLGDEVVISGWGRLTHNGVLPHRLQYNKLTALDGPSCDEATGWGQEQIICLGHEENNGACNGDSGGPATYKNKLVGVAGFVVGGCGSSKPDGYAKVKYHRQWILDNMI